MTTLPTAHHVCQCCGRSGAGEFVDLGTGRWECAEHTGGYREAVNVEYHPDEDHPFQVWVRSWGARELVMTTRALTPAGRR